MTPRRRRLLVAVPLLVVAALGLFAGCTETPRLMDYEGSPGSPTLRVGVDSCNKQPSVEVVAEDDTHVRLRSGRIVRAVGAESSCMDAVTVTLSKPLGQRTVVDDTTGAAVARHP